MKPRRDRSRPGLGGICDADRLDRAAAARADVGDAIRLGRAACRVAVRRLGGDAGCAALRGVEGRGADHPAVVLHPARDRGLLRGVVRPWRGDVRDDHLPAAVHAGRARRVGHTVGQPADAAPDGRRRREHRRRPGDFPHRRIQDGRRRWIGAGRDRDDPLRAHGRGDGAALRGDGDGRRRLRHGIAAAGLHARGAERRSARAHGRGDLLHDLLSIDRQHGGRRGVRHR